MDFFNFQINKFQFFKCFRMKIQSIKFDGSDKNGNEEEKKEFEFIFGSLKRSEYTRSK